MLNTIFTENYISEIPWADNPTFAFGDNAENYRKAFENVLEFVPQTDNKIRFVDDVWDFCPYFENINSYSYKIHFEGADTDYKNYLKFFVIYAISNKSKISTANRRVGDFITIIQSVKDTTNHSSFSLINTEDIINDIEDRDITNSRCHSLFACVHIIYSFILKNYKLELPVDIEILKDKSAHYKKKSKVEDEKTPNIPEEYYTLIVNKAIDVLNDPKQPLNSRMTAGLILIASQTGLRRQDLAGIKVDNLFEKHLPVSGITCHYLHYETRKPSKAHSDMLSFDIYASELCTEAFKKMCKIRQSCEFADQPYLYVLPRTALSANTYPIAESRLTHEYAKFCYSYLYEETQKEWDGITGTVFAVWNSNNRKCNREILNIPKISQFRVHLATALYNNGVSLVYIQRYLGHLSEYMLGYYVRPKDDARENAAYAEKIVKKIAGDHDTPLGNMGEELRANLEKYVESGHYNVQTDARQILDDLGEKLVIREKGPGLCCIKTSIIPCKNDARTNEILCAYGMCPNIFHFYDMIDVTYMQFHALQDSYQENLNNGFDRAAQKELNKLKDFIHRRLNPEVKEFEKVLSKTNIEDFCAEHPDLAYIAHNIDQIKEEIALWEKH